MLAWVVLTLYYKSRIILCLSCGAITFGDANFHYYCCELNFIEGFTDFPFSRFSILSLVSAEECIRFEIWSCNWHLDIWISLKSTYSNFPRSITHFFSKPSFLHFSSRLKIIIHYYHINLRKCGFTIYSLRKGWFSVLKILIEILYLLLKYEVN